jgi:hypothetical protein
MLAWAREGDGSVSEAKKGHVDKSEGEDKVSIDKSRRSREGAGCESSKVCMGRSKFSKGKRELGKRESKQRTNIFLICRV